MSVKMKGLFKGLRYISHIFEEEKEEEIQIGLPTDVKHVAHIGWDGPSANDSAPSWLDNFKSANAFQSAPLGSPGDPREEPEIKWVSEDSKRSSRAPTSPRSDLPDLPKSSRRHSSTENTDSPRKKEKSRQSRRSKDSSDGSVRSSRRNKEANEAAGSSGSGLPDIPKKSRRKKSKDSFSNEGSSRSRSKGGASSSDPFSDLGNDSGPIPWAQGSQLSPVMERND